MEAVDDVEVGGDAGSGGMKEGVVGMVGGMVLSGIAANSFAASHHLRPKSNAN